MRRYGVIWNQHAFQTLYPSERSDHYGYNVLDELKSLDEFNSFYTSQMRRLCVYATYETGLNVSSESSTAVYKPSDSISAIWSVILDTLQGKYYKNRTTIIYPW